MDAIKQVLKQVAVMLNEDAEPDTKEGMEGEEIIIDEPVVQPKKKKIKKKTQRQIFVIPDDN
jgi:hypothetical protein